MRQRCLRLADKRGSVPEPCFRFFTSGECLQLVSPVLSSFLDMELPSKTSLFSWMFGEEVADFRQGCSSVFTGIRFLLSDWYISTDLSSDPLYLLYQWKLLLEGLLKSLPSMYLKEGKTLTRLQGIRHQVEALSIWGLIFWKHGTMLTGSRLRLLRDL